MVHGNGAVVWEKRRTGGANERTEKGMGQTARVGRHNVRRLFGCSVRLHQAVHNNEMGRRAGCEKSEVHVQQVVLLVACVFVVWFACDNPISI